MRCLAGVAVVMEEMVAMVTKKIWSGWRPRLRKGNEKCQWELPELRL